MTRAFYLDENVSHHLADELRLNGHAVTTTAGERRFGSSDAHQLLYAAERNWTIVTHNRGDFRLLHIAWHLWSWRWGRPQMHAGILVVQDARRHAPGELANAVATLVSDPALRLEN